MSDLSVLACKIFLPNHLQQEPIIMMPSLKMTSIKQEDEKDEANGLPPKFGYPYLVNKSELCLKKFCKNTKNIFDKLSYLGFFLYFCKKIFRLWKILVKEKPSEAIVKIMEKIKKLRKERGYSNESMAMDLNISTSAYNKIERMESTISLERFIQIREILKVPYSEFFESSVKNVYIQDLKDHSIGHYEVQTLNQENRETTKKLIEILENEISHLRDEVFFLREIAKKAQTNNKK